MIDNVQVYRPGMGMLYPHSDGHVVVQHGDILRVHISFNYRQPAGFVCDIIVYLGTRDAKALSTTLRQTLPPAPEFEHVSYVIDLEIKKPGLLGIGGISPGTYNLGVEIPQGNAYEEIPGAIEVTAAPGILDSIGSLISMMVIMMMMGMMMNMMDE